MKPRDIAIKELKNAGYIFDRHGENHDMYRNDSLKCKIPLKRHNDFDESDLRYIRKEIKQNESDAN